MPSAWTALEASLYVNAPALLADLNPPATNEALCSLQQHIGATLPKDFLECLRGHDGQKGLGDPLFGAYEFLSTERIVDAWSFWKKQSERSDFSNDEADPGLGVRGDWWNSKWIPFASNGSGDYLCLDLAPTESGTVGQVITLWHDDGARKVKGKDFLTWFSGFL